MFYSWEIVVASTNTSTNPKTQELKLTAGVIVRIDVAFRSGCHGLVFVRILHEESPLVPLNKDTWLQGDNEVVSSWQVFDIGKGANYLKFVGYGAGTTYDHSISVRVNMLPPWAKLFAPVYSMIGKLFSRIGIE